MLETLDPAAAAAAKSLQSCPTLCDPIDGSSPGSPVPGIVWGRGWGATFIVPEHWLAQNFKNTVQDSQEQRSSKCGPRTIMVWEDHSLEMHPNHIHTTLEALFRCARPSGVPRGPATSSQGIV